MRRVIGMCCLVVLAAWAYTGSPACAQTEPIDIGSRLEPMVDDYLIAGMSGVDLRLHPATPREVVLVFDAPWEGNTSCYVTVFEDDGLFRMYYRASNYTPETRNSTPQRVCYAVSADGIHWAKPSLGLFEYEGSTENNIIWEGVGVHNFSPFKDMNPDCPPEARYKAVGSGEDKAKLLPFHSADGIHWTLTREEPIITEGAFDSHNLAFYDTHRGRYVEFHRGFTNNVRAIMTSASEDFLNWPAPEWLQYSEGTPDEHLYTNAITAYHRAPHIFMGLPMRFVPGRDLKVHEYPGVSDTVFMTSRDGVNWRRWREAMVRPGLQSSRWVNRNNMAAWGILQTRSDIPGHPDEISIYTTEGYYVGPCNLRRFTSRLDGFVSVHASPEGGEFATKPLVFAGTNLLINYATSAAGAMRCEIQDADGNPVPGYALDDCDEIFGDYIERAVTWNGKAELDGIAGTPVRLRFVMADADLYALRFR